MVILSLNQSVSIGHTKLFMITFYYSFSCFIGLSALRVYMWHPYEGFMVLIQGSWHFVPWDCGTGVPNVHSEVSLLFPTEFSACYCYHTNATDFFFYYSV
jgi:hypothetical protein